AQSGGAQGSLTDRFHDDHEHAVTGAAPCDIAHGRPVDPGLPQLQHVATGVALPERSGRVEAEQAAGRSGEDVAVQMSHQIPPNRSVRMLSAACPISIIAAATASTNPVGPQM